jgi:hypothetical protein
MSKDLLFFIVVIVFEIKSWCLFFMIKDVQKEIDKKKK